MEKSILRLALAMVLVLNIAFLALAQEPKAEKDTINADKAAKPVFYQAAEEEKSSEGCSPIVYVVGAVIVVAGVALILRKKKK
jgi:tagatose-1,6-bisphosphate aldolase non-catalytic subunit AgaZ/GatZ